MASDTISHHCSAPPPPPPELELTVTVGGGGAGGPLTVTVIAADAERCAPSTTDTVMLTAPPY